MKNKRESPKRAAFLAAYAQCGNISEAARLAGCHRSQHYEWMNSDPEYAAAFAAAHDEAIDTLELEARRRAHDGVAEPVVYQGKLSYEPEIDAYGNLKRDEKGEILYTKTPLTVRRYSDVLLIFLLKGARPSKYRDSHKGEADTLPRPTVPGLQHLSDAELEQLEFLARKARGQ